MMLRNHRGAGEVRFRRRDRRENGMANRDVLAIGASACGVEGSHMKSAR